MATGLIVIAVVEEFPQRLPTEMRGRVELFREFPRFILIFQEAKVEENILWRRGVNRQPAEAIDIGLGFPWQLLHCEVVLLQRC